ncbi:MAG: hypothetical protein WCP73_03780 [Eubacteriales bacterium]
MVKTKVIFWIAFILVAATGGLLGYYFAMGEPTVFNQQYLNQEVLQAANTEVVLASDADIEVQYTYLMCGHKEKVELAGDLRFTGKTAKQIKSENPGCQIRDFGTHKMVILMDVNEYCPQHYIIKLDNGKVCIFKTNRVSGKSELYLDLKLDATAVKPEELDRLRAGVVYENTSDVNNYLYSIKN